MRVRSNYWSSVLLLVLMHAASIAQWKQISGPGPQSITVLYRSGSALYAGTDGSGLHVSTDDGETWVSMNGSAAYGSNTLLHGQVRSILVEGDRTIVGSYAGGMWHSTNGGTSWTRYGSPLGSGNSINGLVKVDSVILAGGSGMFRSTNGGSTWTSSTTGLTNTNVRAMTSNGMTAFAATDNGFFRSTDLGVSWSMVDSGMAKTGSRYTMAMAAANGVVYGTFSNGYSGQHVVFRSTDNGTSWDSSNGNLTNLSTSAIGAYGDTVFVGLNNNGLRRSTDRGETWTDVTTGGASYPLAILAYGTRVLVGGNKGNSAGDGGVFLSTSNGSSWTRVTSAMSNGSSIVLQAVGDRLAAGVDAGTSSVNSGFYVTSDRGARWERKSQGLMASGNPVKVTRILQHGSRLYVSAATNVPQGVFVSSDSGNTWTQAISGLYQYADVYQFMADADTVYIAAKEGLFRTTNGGGTWTSSMSGVLSGEVISVAMRGDTLYATKGNNRLYRSEDRGRTWTYLTVDLPQYQYVYQLWPINGKFYALGGNGNGRLFQSADSGSHWTEVNAARFTGNNLVTGVIGYKGSLIVTTVSGGIHISTNGGSSWTTYNQGINDAYPTFTSAVVLWDSLYATRGSAVYVRRLSEFGITSVDADAVAEVPSSFGLMANYPNPFNPATTIAFRTTTRGHVTLRVYNLVGQQVAMLVDSELSAGAHTVAWDAASMASGMYLSVLEAAGQRAVHRMVLMR
jgi:hypothetical protein